MYKFFLYGFAFSLNANAASLDINGGSISFDGGRWKIINHEKKKDEDKTHFVLVPLRTKTDNYEKSIVISNTDSKNPTIKKLNNEDANAAKEAGADPLSWYLGGMLNNTNNTALISNKGDLTILETTGLCGISYKNGNSGTGLCYFARIMGGDIDLDVLAGPKSFSEMKDKNTDSSIIFKDVDFKEYSIIVHSTIINK